MPPDINNPTEFLLSVMESQAEVETFDGLKRLEHGLQCAMNAERDGASPALITTSLLHDIGSILRADYPELVGDTERGHEEIGADFLSHFFGPDVTAPVALHVLAKRHLIAQQPGYADKLNPVSVASLEKQGLPLTSAESKKFLDNEFAANSLLLRHWDEDAKRPGAETPSLAHFRQHLESCLRTDG
jgi:gamma-butyrobetaine dioxygenase